MGYLREAVWSDADLLFQWANEKSVRKNSFSTDKISYEEHMKWYKDVLLKDTVIQFIFVQDEEPIGQVRVKISGQEAEIGYSICAEKRRMGYGKEMLVLLTQKVKQDYPYIKRLKAKVKSDNTASQKVFFDIGYDLKYYRYEMEL